MCNSRSTSTSSTRSGGFNYGITSSGIGDIRGGSSGGSGASVVSAVLNSSAASTEADAAAAEVQAGTGDVSTATTADHARAAALGGDGDSLGGYDLTGLSGGQNATQKAASLGYTDTNQGYVPSDYADNFMKSTDNASRRQSDGDVLKNIQKPTRWEGTWDKYTGKYAEAGSNIGAIAGLFVDVTGLGVAGRLLAAEMDPYDYFDSPASNRGRLAIGDDAYDELFGDGTGGGHRQANGYTFMAGDGGGDESGTGGTSAAAGGEASVNTGASGTGSAASVTGKTTTQVKRGWTSMTKTSATGVTGTANILKYVLGG